MIGGICGGCAGLGLVGLMGFVGAAGVAGAAGSAGQPGSTEAAQVAAVGGIGMLIGVLYLALGIAAFVGSIGMLKTQRKGFTITMIVMALLGVLSIVSMVTLQGGVQSIVGLVIDLGLAFYCWGRLNGKIGPALPA